MTSEDVLQERSSGPEPAAGDDLKSRAVPGDPDIVSGDQSRRAARLAPATSPRRRVKSVDNFVLAVSGGGTIMHVHNGSQSRPMPVAIPAAAHRPGDPRFAINMPRPRWSGVAWRAKSEPRTPPHHAGHAPFFPNVNSADRSSR